MLPMSDELAYRDVDREFYGRHLRGFLPARLLDVHMHVHLQQHVPPLTDELRARNWAAAVSHPEYSMEMAEADYAKLFPGSDVHRLQFGTVYRESNFEACNDYCASGADRERVWALAVVDPAWSGEHLRELLIQGRFSGIKPYWSMVPGKKEAEVRLEEMISPPQLEVLDELGLVATVHVPGPERIRDTHTREVLRQWCARYPNATFVIAHLGRAYCFPFAEAAFPDLATIDDLMFDCSAFLHPDGFELAFKTIGPQRIMWGTDFPVLSRMRGYRVWEGETYRNVTSADYPWNTDREPPEVEAKYTYFIYQALKAMREGAERAGLTTDDLKDVFFGNAHKLLTRTVA
jgi:predicted TIM-barrel fold metal-dependent hydrolase